MHVFCVVCSVCVCVSIFWDMFCMYGGCLIYEVCVCMHGKYMYDVLYVCVYMVHVHVVCMCAVFMVCGVCGLRYGMCAVCMHGVWCA
jgi:hypothetical protein